MQATSAESGTDLRNGDERHGHRHSSTVTLTVSQTQPAGVNVLTYHNDVAQAGQNLSETILTLANVNSASFGKLGNLAVDAGVDAEPLYISILRLWAALTMLCMSPPKMIRYTLSMRTLLRNCGRSPCWGRTKPPATTGAATRWHPLLESLPHP